MITVKVNMSTHLVKVTGHSDRDAEGRDIVCAAVSMLFYTLAESLLKAEHMFWRNGLRVKAVSGDSKITCIPVRKYLPNVNLMFWMFCNGVQLLADQYPENVTLSVVGG